MDDFQQPQTAQKRRMKLSTLVTLMVCSVIGAVLLVIYTFYLVQITKATRTGLQDTAFAIARTLADSPEVQRGLALPSYADMIQPMTNAIVQRNHLLYAVVTDMKGIRYSHPDERRIGQRFIGEDLLPALQGQENVSINHGVLEEALRVFTPIYDARHRQLGVVIVGISMNEIQAQIDSSRWNAVWFVIFSAIIGAFGTWVLVRVLKNILFGLEPYEISSLFEQRQAMLHSLKEGVIAVDREGNVTLVNHTARQILLSATTRQPGELPHAPLQENLQQVLETGIAIQDREVGCNGRLLLTNTVPVRSQNHIIGAICTFRDKTEVSQLMQRMDGMVNYVDALRAQSHEFMNKLHVILGLLHIKRYDKLEEYILQTAQNYQTDVGTIQQKIKSPIVAGFLLGKINRAKESGFILTLAEESRVPDNPDEQQVAVLVTVLGNLIENALDAMTGQDEGEISLLLHYQNGWLSSEVSDDGPGIAPEQIDAIFNKGFSTKGDNRGVGLFLAKQQTENLGGSITVESEPGVFTQFFVQIPWDSERNVE